MPKKKQVEMPKIGKSNIKKSWWVATGIALAVLITVSVWARVQSKKEVATEYIAKGVVTNYVCKVVGANPDEDMFAVQCFTK